MHTLPERILFQKNVHENLLLFLYVTYHALSSTPEKLGKLIIDTDVGGDDAAAILLALAAEAELGSDGFKIIAITCTYGNANVTNVEKNVLKVLTIANRSDVRTI